MADDSNGNAKTGLRKGLTNYGDEGFSLFLRRAFIKGAGYTDDALAHHGVLDEGLLFLEKPFSPANLARKVREVLDSHTAIIHRPGTALQPVYPWALPGQKKSLA